MAAEDVQRIRSIGLIGQGDVGKTTLGEAMLFVAGAIPRMGRVDDGTATLDFEPEETRHQVSLATGFHHFSWKKHEVTLADTPGYANFLPETRACIRALTGAVLVLSPTGDLKVEAERVSMWAREEGVPLIAFVNRMDRERAELASAVKDLAETLGGKAAVVHHPIGHEGQFRGVVDLLTMKAHVVEGEGEKPKVVEVPADIKDEVDAARSALMEAVAETDDALLERYLEEGELSSEELVKGLVSGTRNRTLVPVLCGVAPKLIGVEALLDGIVDYLPSPAEFPPAQGDDPRTGDTVERPPSPDAPFSAFVFKTMVDPFVGKLTIFRVLSGKAVGDAAVHNASRDAKERFGPVLKLEGKKQQSVAQALPGEIVAVAKLKETMTGDTLCEERAPIVYPGLPDFQPVISFAVEPKSRADEDKAITSLKRLVEEDPSLVVGRDDQTREILLSGAGQSHIEVVVERLKRKYNVEVVLKAPKVPYKETIKGTARAQGKYKKQTGGRGQFGDTWIQVDPLRRGAGFEFVNQIVGGSIPRQYIPAVEKGVREALAGGLVAGYPLVDVKVTLYDGSYHEVDSSEMSFKIAGSLGVKNALQQAKPTVLEPIMNIEVTVPNECVGDVIGDLNSRRGRVVGVDAKGGHEVIRGTVPMVEVLQYAPDLRSMTSGRGGFRVEFAHYEELPPHLIDKVVKESQAAKAAGEKESR
jgi:elongation factor G